MAKYSYLQLQVSATTTLLLLMANLTPSNIPESAKMFFASVSSPTEILLSNLVSRVQVIEARNLAEQSNHVHILNFNTGDQGLFSFVLRFPVNPNAISRWQTSTSVGCMLYCQRHPNLNIPTPAIYAYSCTYGSEFIAMEYINGDTLSEVWQDLPEEDKENMVCQVAEVMCTMRTKTSFSRIGGIGPDGSACPLVNRVNVDSGRVSLAWTIRVIPQMLNVVQGVIDSLGLYNIGPLVFRGLASFVFLHFTQVRLCARIHSVCSRPSIPLRGSNIAQGRALSL